MNHRFQFSSADVTGLSSTALMAAAKEITASDGEKIRWVEFGYGRRPLVVSPALGTPLVSWLPALSVLAENFRIFFALTRGGCEGPTPKVVADLSVQRRGEDLAELINLLDLDDYSIVAHSSGVFPAIVCLRQLSTPPSRVCLISSRYSAGEPIGAEKLLQRARNDAGFMNVVRSIIINYSPPSTADVMRELLRDFSRLEAFLRAFDLSRAFSFTGSACAEIPTTFVIAQHDPEDVRKTTRQIVDAQADEQWTLIDVPDVGHFFVQDCGEAAAALINASLCL